MPKLPNVGSKKGLSEAANNSANALLRRMIREFDRKGTEMAEEGKRKRATKAELQQRYTEMAELVQGGMGSGEAAEQIAEKYEVAAGSIKVGWPKWAKENGYESLVGSRGGGGTRAASSSAPRAGQQTDVVGLLKRQQERLELEREEAEATIKRVESELEKINKALEVLQ